MKGENRQESKSSLRLLRAPTTHDDLPKMYQVKVREISRRRVDDTDRDERGLSRREVDRELLYREGRPLSTRTKYF